MTNQVIIMIIGIVVSILSAIITVCLMSGRYQEKVDSLKETAKEQNTKLENLRTDVDKLQEFKLSTQKYIDSKIYTSNSPLSLTEYGHKIINESGFNTIFATTKDDLVKKLEIKAPHTKYDVQEKARELMSELIDYPPFKSIKTLAFEKGFDYEQILRAGAILLRDYYFEKHPEITI